MISFHALANLFLDPSCFAYLFLFFSPELLSLEVISLPGLGFPLVPWNSHRMGISLGLPIFPRSRIFSLDCILYGIEILFFHIIIPLVPPYLSFTLVFLGLTHFPISPLHSPIWNCPIFSYSSSAWEFPKSSSAYVTMLLGPLHFPQTRIFLGIYASPWSKISLGIYPFPHNRIISPSLHCSHPDNFFVPPGECQQGFMLPYFPKIYFSIPWLPLPTWLREYSHVSLVSVRLEGDSRNFLIK